MTKVLRALGRVGGMFRRGRRDSSVDAQGRGGPWAQAWGRLRRKKVAFGALILIVILYVGGALAPWTAPRDYRETPSTNLEDLPGFQGLVISPRWAEDSTLYNYTPIGVFRSENAGGSWEQVNTGLGAVNVDVLAPVSMEGANNVVFTGTPQGIFVSRDGAFTWAEASDGLPENRGVKHLAASPSFGSDGIAIAALSGGLYRSGDGGSRWSNVNDGFQSEAPAASHVVFSPDFAFDSTVFATVTERKTGSFRTVEEVYRSTDGGISWAPVYEASAGVSREATMAISPAFGRDGTLYVTSSEGLLRSRDRGSTWELLDERLNSQQVLALLVSPDYESDRTIFANTGSLGIFRSVDEGASWVTATSGLSITKAEGLAISPDYGRDGTLFAGTVDGGLFLTTNGGEAWSELASTDLIEGPSIFRWPPSLEHPLGTDRIGRDLLSRVIYGIRTTVIITLASVLTGSLLIGVFMGAAAGYFGRRVDTVIMRIGDIFLAFPGILLIILIAATVKPRVVEWVRAFEDWSGIDGIVRSGGVDYFVVFASLTLFSWVGMARLVRGQLLWLKESQYVEAARAMGASNMRIIFRHLLPNALSPVIVSVSVGMGAVAGSEVVLSWFGIGIQPPNPSLGRMILENFGISNLSILRDDPHLLLVPAATIAILIYAWNLLGDGLNDVLNPRTR